MDITINIAEEDISTEDASLIRNCLSINTNEEYVEAIRRLLKTSIMEYKKMFKEKGLPTRADEVLQDRLFFLITFYYVNRLPNESEISSIFQLSSTQSKTLLKNTISRYRTRVTEQIRNTIYEVVRQGNRDEVKSQATMVIFSDNVLEQLNLIVSQYQPHFDKIARVRGSAGEYKCSLDTYNFLIEHLRG